MKQFLATVFVLVALIGCGKSSSSNSTASSKPPADPNLKILHPSIIFWRLRANRLHRAGAEISPIYLNFDIFRPLGTKIWSH